LDRASLNLTPTGSSRSRRRHVPGSSRPSQENVMARVCVIGTGYVGLTTGACFANLGNEVTCLDVDEATIALLRAGGMPIYEPGLEEVVQRNAAAGRLRFTTSYAEAVPGAEVLFIAVNTPQSASGHADMSHVEAAAATLAQHLAAPAVVVNK